MPDSKQLQRIVNRSHVLQTLRVSSGISRIEISRQLGLDRSTITNLVNPLLEMSIVKVLSEGSSPSKGGRRPVLLGINENFGSILGIDLQNSSFSAVLTNLNGEILKEWRGDMKFMGLVETILRIYSLLENDINEMPVPLIGIGVGIPAIVDTEQGFVRKATSLHIRELDFNREAEGKFPVPVIIDNDANCCAWGQLERNKERRLDNFLNIIWKLHRLEGEEAPEEIEIGMGIVLGGEVYYGSGSAAGELPEDLLSRDAANIYRQSGTGWEIDEKALGIYLDKLFNFLIPIFNVFDPGEIFFGGHFTRFRSHVEKHMSGTSFKVNFPRTDELDTAYGAASMFVEKLFQTPVLKGDREGAEIREYDLFSRFEQER
ncbi:MAG: ROK family transcriptional regulator [Spirochaetales bacterium]|nr:ROK family transcriptional regulator [Spirochaetales bacterium]